MKIFRFSIFTLLFFCISLYAQNIPGSGPGLNAAASSAPTNGSVGFPSFQKSSVNSDVYVFATTTYTFQDIVIFSYFNQSVFYLLDDNNAAIDSVELNENEYYTFSPGTGIYRIEGNKSFTLLIGDPVSKYVLGFFAVDESGSPLSTRLNTYMPSEFDGREHFIIFGYSDNTSFTIKNLTDTTTVAAGILNAGEHFTLDDQYSKFLSVISDKKVSALSYGDQEYFIPSTNGTFQGTTFYGYSGYVGSWSNGVVITPYSDSTSYLITNTETGDTLLQGIVVLGEAASLSVYADTYWQVDTDKPVTVSNTPYASWSGSYAYLARQIDQSGLGIGTHFITPVIGGNYDIFSYADGNTITVVNKATGDTLYSDILDEGGHYGFYSSKTVYEVTGSENVSIIASTSGTAGADFVPLNFAVGLPDLSLSADGISFSPDTEDRKTGDPIELMATIYNYGFATAYQVPFQFFDGDPSGGLPIGPVQYADSIPAGGMKMFQQSWNVPDLPEYHAVFGIIDQNETIVESNSSNNIAYKFIITNDDLLPPLTTVIDGPVSVMVDEQSVPEFDTFNLAIDLFNTGDVTADSVVIKLKLPAGLSFENEADSLVIIEAIEAKTSYTNSYTININDASIGSAFFYSFIVGASNVVEKIVERMLIINRPSALENETSLPEDFYLAQNYPNPFNPNTTIKYTIAKPAKILLQVYDISGRLVETLVDKKLNRGNYSAHFDAKDHSSGIFFLRMNVDGNDIGVRKMTLLK